MFRTPFSPKALAVPLACVALVLGACAMPRPYTLDIQQGVVIDQKMVSRLKAGMTRSQASLALGTPLLTDPLHADRWDYVYYTRVKGNVGEWRRLTLNFKDDRLASIVGDVRTAAPGEAASGAATPAAETPPAASGTGLPAPLPEGAGPGPRP